MKKLSKKENIWQMIKFTLFSISAGIIQIISFTIFNELFRFNYWASYLIALLLSILFNFTINRRFTFKSAANVPKAMLLVLAYYAVFTPLSTWWGDALEGAGINEYIVLGGTMIINFVTEYLFQRFVVYRKSINTNDIAKKEEQEEHTD